MCRKINGPTRRVEANLLGGDGAGLRLLADPLGLGRRLFVLGAREEEEAPELLRHRGFFSPGSGVNS